jgi:predicted metalloprotease
MDLNENAQIDTGQVRDVGRSGGGGGLAGIPIPMGRGGGIMTLIVLAVLVIGGIVGGNTLLGDDSGGGDDLGQQCAQDNPDRLQNVKCRNALFVNSIQNYWQTALPQSFGQPYQEADTVFFDQFVSTGCGQADSGVGPFYCPQDDLVYIDLSFWDELASRFGADGAFAQPYVLAHEYGHHVQDVLGTEAQVRRLMERDPGNANRYSVMLELQADCYSGVWTHHASRTTDAGGQPIFKSVTRQDIADALEAAASVGDDAIQKKMGGGVDESKFTHGSSAQRQQWFNRGYDGGDPKGCDTFGNAL